MAGMFSVLNEQSALTRRQKWLATIATWAVCLEFLDYFLIGFILVFVSAPWNLTFGQSSVILLSSGVGAIAGAIFFGRLADRIGRRRVFLITVLVFSIGTGLLVLTPNDPSIGWLYLSILRVVIGFGAGGLYVVDLPLVQEYMPTAKRAKVTGIVTAAVPAGFLLGSLMVWLLSDAIGWRGIVAIAAALGFALYLVRRSIPESPRYLARNGDLEGARSSIAWVLDVDPKTLQIDELNEGLNAAKATPGLKELLPYRRSLWLSSLANLGIQTGYYGITLWTPTLLVAIMAIDPSQSGMYMVFVTFGALAGRFGLSYLAEWIGRRAAGALASFTAAALLMVAATTGVTTFAGISLFFLVMIVVYFFGEGGFAIVGPYSGEVWPSRLRTTGMGFSYGIGGIGKVIGPLGLGLILGSGDLLKPGATIDGLALGFSYFAAWYILCGLMFLFLGIETKGKTLEELDAEFEQQRHRTMATRAR